MSLKNKIISIVDQYDCRVPQFKVNVRSNHINFSEPPFDKGDIKCQSYLGGCVHNNIEFRKLIDKGENGYVYKFDHEKIINRVINNIASTALNLFLKTSPAKAPRRTKLWKSYQSTIDHQRGKENWEMLSNLLDIIEYYCTQTKEHSITSSKNIVARNNIYKLLCLMEKKYGEK